jgi:integrase
MINEFHATIKKTSESELGSRFETNDNINWQRSYDLQLKDLISALKDCLRISVRPYTNDLGGDSLWVEMLYPNGVKYLGIDKTCETDLIISDFLNAKGVLAHKIDDSLPPKGPKHINHSKTPFTMPVLRKGKEPTHIPTGGKKINLVAENKWCVEFHFYNQSQDKMVRFRLSNQLNRIKKYKAKLSAFREFQAVITKDLKEGWNPITKTRAKVITKISDHLMIADAVNNFLQYHRDKGNRANTISSYQSKLKLFLDHVGRMKVREIDDLQVTDFLNTLERNKAWTAVTYNYAKRVLNNLFVYLMRYKHVNSNPTTSLEGRKEMKSVLHQVFSDEDFIKIMTWLKDNDPYCLLFVQTIYYTCIRPKELRYTQLEFLDLKNNRIIIPAYVAKNRKAIPVQIDSALRNEFLKLGLEQFPKEYYLFGDKVKIVGPNRIGVNTPYNRFQTCLTKLNLTGKNYTLYSFKHLSNVRKYLAGWTIAEICSANRHSSLVETETYLKDLIKFIPVTKPVPII